MGRKAIIIGQAVDVFGDSWDVREFRPTIHGFNVLLGWPSNKPRGPYGCGGPQVIVTQELADYLERRRHDPGNIELPVGKIVVKRLRRKLNMRWIVDNEAWWMDRLPDMISMTIEAFCAKHGTSAGAVSQWRTRIIGPWLCSMEQQLAMRHVREALRQPAKAAAEKLGLSPAQISKLKARLERQRR